MKSLSIIIVSTCAFLFPARVWSATITAVGNGNWTNGAVWSCGCVPGNNDDIVIPAGRNVTVSSPILLILGPVISITIGGTLTMNNGSITIDSSDVIIVLGGGKIAGTGLLGGTVTSGLTPISIASGSEIDGPLTISNGVLPIKLISFKSTTVGEGIRLEWTSAEERNFDYYDIAWSCDGKIFTSIATIPGKGANGADYTFIDSSPGATTNYYKLIAVDLDGSREDMPVIKGEWIDREDWITIYPNPVTDGTIHVRFFNGGSGSLRLLDCNGSPVVESLVVNAFSSDVDLPATMPPGVYFMSAQIGDRTARVKVMVN